MNNNYINNIEESLIKLRGYVSKFPENRRVVVAFSGGLDSVSIIARCIVDFDLQVYPISITRGQSNLQGELRSIRFFDAFFKEKFPNNYFSTTFLSADIPPQQLKRNLKKYSDKNGYPLRDNQLEIVSLQFAISLWDQVGDVSTIITGITKDDIYTHSSLLAMRSTTLMACVSTPYKHWNISSINVDPFLYGNLGPFGKKEEIQWCSKNNIPIELSRTCNNNTIEHCGECTSCFKRKKAFFEANVLDNTIYANNKIT